LVQPQISQITRVCSYDRAGYAWSEPGPKPRTTLQIVTELHQLLDTAKIPKPYIIVGHSFGGFVARLYSTLYPQQVAGVVLVDASNEDTMAMLPAKMKAAELRRMQLEQFLPYVGYFGIPRIRRAIFGLGQAGRSSPRFPEPLLREMTSLMLWARSFGPFVDEINHILESGEQVRRAGKLGDVPLTVITASRLDDVPDGIDRSDFYNWEGIRVNRLQNQLAQLSTRGRRIVVHDSSHMILGQDPEAVSDAVKEMVYRLRRERSN
jgi:pimeloyl-ACP methyl ester carboxylesterase